MSICVSGEEGTPLQPLQIQVGLGVSEVWPAEKGRAGKKEGWRGRVSRGKPNQDPVEGFWSRHVGGSGAELGRAGQDGEAAMGVQRQHAWRPTGRLMGK